MTFVGIGNALADNYAGKLFSVGALSTQPETGKWYFLFNNGTGKFAYDNDAMALKQGGSQVKIDNGEYSTSATKEIEDGGSCIIAAEHPYGGEFTRWSDNNTQNPRTLSNIQEDITLSAEFDS